MFEYFCLHAFFLLRFVYVATQKNVIYCQKDEKMHFEEKLK